MDNVNICTTNVAVSTSNFRLPFSGSISHHHHQELQNFTPPIIQDMHSLPYHQKPIKKRSNLIKIHDDGYEVMTTSVKPKTKKPDPNAPKITPPCSVCGRKFWSWKALFGHMRCHPERQWRGINPPSYLQPPEFQETTNSADGATTSSSHSRYIKKMSIKDHDAAGSLLMLANSPPPPITTSTLCDVIGRMTSVPEEVDEYFLGQTHHPQTFLKLENSNPLKRTTDNSGLFGQFECLSCKKVFGSHQALGGHRATHRNVKGCFAKQPLMHVHFPLLNDPENARTRAESSLREDDESSSGHKCNICLKVFSSGQALGGHKRCHWEKEDHHHDIKPLLALGTETLVHQKEGLCSWDLNLPAPSEDVGTSCSYSSGLALDLRLGL